VWITSNTGRAQTLCVEKIGSRPRGTLCVDKIGFLGDILAANILAANILAGIIGPEPPGRARPLVLLCHGQETFQTPSLLTYVHLPEFDFINPDSQLLGKKSDPRRSTAAGRENLQSKAADPGRKKCGVTEILLKKCGVTDPPPPPAEKINNPNPLVLLLLLLLLLSSPHGKAGSAGNHKLLEYEIPWK